MRQTRRVDTNRFASLLAPRWGPKALNSKAQGRIASLGQIFSSDSVTQPVVVRLAGQSQHLLAVTRRPFKPPDLMNHYFAAAFSVLFCIAPVAAMAAEPLKSLQTQTKTLETAKAPAAPSIEAMLQQLAISVAQQNHQIQQLKFQVQAQAQTLASQAEELASAEDRLAAFEQAVSVENGVLSINYPVVEISADLMTIGASMLDVEGNLSVGGFMESDSVITKSVISESYTPGAGNIW